MGPVAHLLAMDRTTLTAALKPLQKRGLIAIEPDPKDKRGKRLRLTPEGMALLTLALPIWTQTHADVEAQVSGGDADRLRQDLVALG